MDYRSAERKALAWMRNHGFEDAKLTNAGADGGIDVASPVAVAQVKAEAKLTGRPAIQRIHGVAANQGKQALFFSLAGYTGQAHDWANEAGVALFHFSDDRSIQPTNVHARRLLDARQAAHPGAIKAGAVTLRGSRGELDEVSTDIPFTFSDCDSCGEYSPNAAGCQFCRAMPATEDPHVSARRRLVETARARVSTPSVVTSHATPTDILNRFAEENVIERHLTLVSQVAGADANWESKYAQNLQDFRLTKEMAMRSSSRTASNSALVWPMVDQLLKHASDAIDAHERAITASTPDLAASFFDSGQHSIDRFLEVSRQFQEETAQRPVRQIDAGGFARSTGSGCLLGVGLWLLVAGSVLKLLAS